MPEGPSLVILRDLAQSFTGERIRKATGNAKIDKARLIGQRIVALRTWGKHFLIELDGFSVRIHFMMFGRWCINERKDIAPRLSLACSRKRELNFYNCAVRYVEGDLDDHYDWRTDVMSDAWDPALARRRLRRMPNELICDALLDQDVFAGVGNIIKNEVLFRVRVHPQSKVGALPAATLRALVEQARQYSFEFLEWKRAFVLRQHWLVHNKGVCPRCHGRLTRAYLGKRERRSFFCERCQTLETIMPFKSKAQRRKFAQLLVEGKIKPETFEEWNRETGSKELPEKVAAKKKRPSQKKAASKKKAAPAAKSRRRKN